LVITSRASGVGVGSALPSTSEIRGLNSRAPYPAAQRIQQGYWTFILHFAPADLSGFNVCALSTTGCRKACLNTAGRGGIKAGTGILSYNLVKRGVRNEIQRARRLRTRAFF
jgi:hypothetical protein